jgi:glutathione synthase/RimK-type ligase-like ATP-grasp enzyme
MIISIIPDKNNNEGYSKKWAQFIREKGHEVNMLDFSDEDLLGKVKNSDGLMWLPIHNPDDKQKARRLLLVVEKYFNLPVFPDFNTYWHYDDKVSQFYLFSALDIPTPKTWVFWDKSQALAWANEVSYPVVHKLAVGASSSNVVMLTTIEQAKKQIERDFQGYVPGTVSPLKRRQLRRNIGKVINRAQSAMRYLLKGNYPPLPLALWQVEKNYSYFQQYLPDNSHDTRVNIIGDRAFAFRRWNRPDDFRASGSGLLDYDLTSIDMDCVKIAFSISRKARFQSMAYDFLYNDGIPVVSEISYAYLDQAVYDCQGYWDSYLNWHEGHIWPQEAQVEDFLQFVEEKKKDFV